MVEAVTPPNPADGGGARSVPDPTLLTIDALRREIAMLENLIDTRLIEAEKLRNEQFESMHTLMERGEEQRREQKSDTASAVSAALESQKEATTKMEKSISDQIASLRSNFETSIRGIHANLADLKDRLTILESVKVGQAEQKTETRQVTSSQLGLFGAVMIVVVLIVNIVLFMIARGAPM